MLPLAALSYQSDTNSNMTQATGLIVCNSCEKLFSVVIKPPALGG